MKKLTATLFFLIAGALIFASCDKKDSLVSSVENGSNLAGFTENSKTVTNISNGDTYKIKLPVKIFGPSARDLSGDYTLTIEPTYKSPGDTADIPDSVRAKAGKNFKIAQNHITLKKSDNYLGAFYLTMLTKGVTAPLLYKDSTSKSPTVYLKVKSVDGEGNVIASGKPITVKLNYACASELQGVYNVQASVGGTVFKHDGAKVIKTGIGQYETTSIGGFWTVPGSPYRPDAVLNFGVKFSDVCGELTVKDSNLGGVYTNAVSGNAKTKVKGNSQVAGEVVSFQLQYNIDGLGDYKATYTYQGPLN
jgi:hypothetical protein